MARAEMRIELVWSPAAGETRQGWVELPEGATLEHALRAWPQFTAPVHADLPTGVWGRRRPLDTVLRERDRVEVYRPLTVDPKEARRQRYQERGERIVSRHRPLAGKTSR